MTMNMAGIPITMNDFAKRGIKILVCVHRGREPLVGQIEIDEEAMMTRCPW
ncbi:hypothetical protein H5T87_10075 [bacterium]|nr:hypothetical protein [bacterium]